MERLRKALRNETTVSKDFVDKFAFFTKKYKQKAVFSIKKKLAIRDDLVKVCELLFNSKEMDKTIETYTLLHKACDGKNKICGVTFDPIFTFLSTIESLRNFYDFNKDKNCPIKDQRVHIFFKLKRKVMCLIVHLNKTVKPKRNTASERAIEKVIEEYLEKCESE